MSVMRWNVLDHDLAAVSIVRPLGRSFMFMLLLMLMLIPGH